MEYDKDLEITKEIEKLEYKIKMEQLKHKLYTLNLELREFKNSRRFIAVDLNNDKNQVTSLNDMDFKDKDKEEITTLDELDLKLDDMDSEDKEKEKITTLYELDLNLDDIDFKDKE